MSRKFWSQHSLPFAIFFALVSALSSSAWADEIVGKVVSFQGRVLIRAATGAPHVAKAGDPIEKGQIINTTSTSSAKILLNDQTIVDIHPSSLFRVDEFVQRKDGDRDVSISLDYGKVRTSVTRPLTNGTFKVKTKTATMGVRGTEFIVLAQKSDETTRTAGATAGALPPPPATQITVIHGQVDVTTPMIGGGMSAPISLKPGSQLMTGALSADGKTQAQPKVVTLAPKELATVKSEGKQPDHTFSNAVVVDTGGGDTGSRGGATLAAAFDSAKVDQKDPKLNGPPQGPPPGFNGPPQGLPNPFGNQYGPSRIQIKFTY